MIGRTLFPVFVLCARVLFANSVSKERALSTGKLVSLLPSSVRLCKYVKLEMQSGRVSRPSHASDLLPCTQRSSACSSSDGRCLANRSYASLMSQNVSGSFVMLLPFITTLSAHPRVIKSSSFGCVCGSKLFSASQHGDKPGWDLRDLVVAEVSVWVAYNQASNMLLPFLACARRVVEQTRSVGTKESSRKRRTGAAA